MQWFTKSTAIHIHRQQLKSRGLGVTKCWENSDIHSLIKVFIWLKLSLLTQSEMPMTIFGLRYSENAVYMLDSNSYNPMSTEWGCVAFLLCCCCCWRRSSRCANVHQTPSSLLRSAVFTYSSIFLEKVMFQNSILNAYKCYTQCSG